MPRARNRTSPIFRKFGGNTTPLNAVTPMRGIKNGSGSSARTIKLSDLSKNLKTAVKLARAVNKLRTKTQTKNKNNKTWPMEENGLKYKTVNLSYKPSKLGKTIKKLSLPGQIYTYSCTGATSGYGVQGAVTLTSCLSTDIRDLYTALNDAVAVTAIRGSEKFLFSGTKHEIEFNNLGPTTLELSIYVLIDKTTSNAPPDPVSLWTSGIAEASNDASAPVETAATLWQKPTTTKAFNLGFWTKRYPISLTPGEKCKFTLNFRPNRVLDTSYIQNFAGVRGLAHRIMIVQNGTLVDGTQTKGVGAGLQTISETKMIWAMKRTMYGQILATLPRVIKQVGTFNFPITALAAWHIDEDTGEPENADLAAEFA